MGALSPENARFGTAKMLRIPSVTLHYQKRGWFRGAAILQPSEAFVGLLEGFETLVWIKRPTARADSRFSMMISP